MEPPEDRAYDAFITWCEEGDDAISTIIHGRPFILAGGTSWGDTPGDVFDSVCILAESRVLDDPMPWAEPKPDDLERVLDALRTMILPTYDLPAEVADNIATDVENFMVNHLGDDG
jgi:hypothetical protein